MGLASNLDRFVSAPVLLAVAAHFRVSVAAAAAVVSSHLLCYGASQLPWAALTQRWGSVRALRISLGGAGVFAAAAAAAPNLSWLVASRALGGLFLAAAVPAALLYVATQVRAEEQQRGFAAIVAANGIGIVLATGIAAVSVAADRWRGGYLAVAMFLLACSLSVRTLVETRDTPGLDAGEAGQPRRRLQHVVGARVADVVRPALLVLIEGVTVVGGVMALPVLADAADLPSAVGWISLALYGLAMPMSGRVLAQWRRVPAGLPGRTVLGGLVVLVSSAGLWLAPPLLAVLATAALLGCCWSALHPVLQEAATRVWPLRPAYALGIFVTSLFVGSGLGAQAFAFAAERGAGVTSLALLVGALTLLLAERVTRSAS